MRMRGAAAVLTAMAVTMFSAGAAQVTLADLLRQMIDLNELAVLPNPAFTCKQFSSYDRRSTDPDVATDENWFANADRGQHLREEQRNGATEWVMMDADGPGAIVRIWSANPNDAGIVRIYLDGAEEPAVEMPLLDLLAGDAFPFIGPVAGERARGWNSFLPIPYATHCKVTSSKPDFYYHINYRTYAPGTRVEPFTLALADAHRPQIEAVAKRLAMPEPPDLPRDAEPQVLVEARLAPGESHERVVNQPNRAVYRLNAAVKAEDVAAAVRGCWFEIFFDGMEHPAVAAPLGDFFGTAPGLNTHQALPSGVLVNGALYANWVMPFQREARFRVTNHSGHSVRLLLTAMTAPRPWTPDSLYFHAAWRAEFDIPTQPRQDWTYIAITGAGRYAGNALQVTNPTPAWWGEGDEKIYVDNEAFPSHFGTGTEDYYGYAWCSPEVFVHAYHNQPRCDGPGNYGYTNVSRFHILDVIPFTEAFKFDMEVWHWADVNIDMAATSYWYATEGSSHNLPALDPALLRIAEIPPVPRVEGALEGEHLNVVSITGGQTSVQGGAAWEWSNAEQLWWTGAQEGAELVLAFPVQEAGRYDVQVVLTTANDYGIVTLAVNEGAPSDAIDLYTTHVKTTPAIDLGAHELAKGDNLLKVTLVGTNPKAKPAYMFGIDYIMLLPKS
jgi:hypothetical protein